MSWEFCATCKPMTRARCSTGCPRVTTPASSEVRGGMGRPAMEMYIRRLDAMRTFEQGDGI